MKLYSATVSLAGFLLAAGCASEATAPEGALRVLRSTQAQATSPAGGTIVYNAIPTQLPGNVPSLGFQATSTAEFGDFVALAGSARNALSATVLMSSWSLHSHYPTLDAAGYTHPITLNIYNVDSAGPTPALGASIASVTREILIPWRPEPSPACGSAWWSTRDSKCYNGYAFTIEFDLRSLALTLPDKFIFGVAYNTNTWGYAPIGHGGPYESLNVGLANVGGSPILPSVGFDPEPDAVFWNTSYAGFYGDLGEGGVGAFRRDFNQVSDASRDPWAQYPVAVQFSAFTVATTASSCKNGGWQSLSRTDASSFRNQGDCVSFVATGK